MIDTCSCSGFLEIRLLISNLKPVNRFDDMEDVVRGIEWICCEEVSHGYVRATDNLAELICVGTQS